MRARAALAARSCASVSGTCERRRRRLRPLTNPGSRAAEDVRAVGGLPRPRPVTARGGCPPVVSGFDLAAVLAGVSHRERHHCREARPSTLSGQDPERGSFTPSPDLGMALRLAVKCRSDTSRRLPDPRGPREAQRGLRRRRATPSPSPGRDRSRAGDGGASVARLRRDNAGRGAARRGRPRNERRVCVAP
jgi:hypothetical protein